MEGQTQATNSLNMEHLQKVLAAKKQAEFIGYPLIDRLAPGIAYTVQYKPKSNSNKLHPGQTLEGASSC